MFPACFLNLRCIFPECLQARNFSLAVGAAYIAEAGPVLGQAGVPKHAIVTSINKVIIIIIIIIIIRAP
jgi:hypothetical protein